MNTYKRSARIIGILYIIGTVAGILSLVFTEALRAPDYLVALAESRNTYLMGMLLILLMGLSLAMMAVVAFPIFKKENETLAVSFVVFRSALEAVTYVASIVNMLLLLSVSEAYINAGAGQTAVFEQMGAIMQNADIWINYMRILIFSVSAIIINTILYRSKLVPRWISVWGLVGAVLHIANSLLGIFGVIDALSTTATLIDMPIALQEMVFAVYLIVKGFSAKAQD